MHHCVLEAGVSFHEAEIRVADDIIEKMFDKQETQKIMSCNFNKLPKEKYYGSDDIMDGKNEAQDDYNEVDFVAKECPKAKLVFDVLKQDH